MPRRYLTLLRGREVRRVLGLVGAEGCLLYGGFTFVGAFLNHDLGIGYAEIGVILAAFGIGGLSYSGVVPLIVHRFREHEMAMFGGVGMALGLAACALTPASWPVAPALASAGFGFYLMHNTLQTRASQMAPHVRGLGMSLFSAAYFLGQAAGVGACGLAVDAFGFRSVFAGTAGGLIALSLCAAILLARSSATDKEVVDNQGGAELLSAPGAKSTPLAP